MGQVPAKYILPSAPYGQSDSVNAVNAVQPAALNPQTPLIPPNFTDPGKALSNPIQGNNPQAPKMNFNGQNPFNLLANNSSFRGLFG